MESKSFPGGLAYIIHDRGHGDDRTGFNEEWSAAVFGEGNGEVGGALVGFACPVIDPCALGQVDGIGEGSNEEGIAEHVLLKEIVGSGIIGEGQRHGSHDRHAGAISGMGGRVNVGEQLIAEFGVEMEEGFEFFA